MIGSSVERRGSVDSRRAGQGRSSAVDENVESLRQVAPICPQKSLSLSRRDGLLDFPRGGERTTRLHPTRVCGERR